MKIKKRTKASKMRGRGQGTHGWGARKKHKKSGHRGGTGMAGTGKRGDQRKTLVTKLYGGKYFGKQGITSRGTKKDKTKKINLATIEKNIDSYIKKGIIKKTEKGYDVNLKNHKILGDGEVKNKFFIKAKSASKSAIAKIKKAGGEIQAGKEK
ncbi:MAG: uL15 family ribosomal protein [archaeon]